jgi:hypothetical protein
MFDEARGLVGLPALAAVAAEGRLSGDQLRHVTRSDAAVGLARVDRYRSLL